MAYNNSTIINMVHAYFNGLPNGYSTRRLNTSDNVWYLMCDKANDTTGSYILYTHASAYKAPMYGQCLNGVWTDRGQLTLDTDMANRIMIGMGKNTRCTINFTNMPYDKCLLEFVGNNNGQYLYLALSVVFASGVVSQVAILKKESNTDANAVIENGNIIITGLSNYGVFEARVPRGFNIQQP